MSQFFTSGGQSIGLSASTSVLPMNTQDWSPLGWTGWISLQSKGFSRVFSNTTVQKHQFFGAQLSLDYKELDSTLTSIHDHWKNIALTRRTFVGKVMSLLFNMLSRFTVLSLLLRKSINRSSQYSLGTQSASVLCLVTSFSVHGMLESTHLRHLDASWLGINALICLSALAPAGWHNKK